MNRPILICASLCLHRSWLGCAGAKPVQPYEGTSNPPSDDTITTPLPAQPKPAPGRPAYADQQGVQPNAQPSENPAPTSRPDPRSQTPALSKRAYKADPDGDIVHVRPLPPGDLGEGTTIRVRLMHRLSTGISQKGEAFRTRVASDVVGGGGQILIPAGSEIDGRVVDVSRGHTGGHGTMRLLPEQVIMADGTRFRLIAELTATPGSNTRVGSEGTVRPGSQLKRDGIEYGAVAGGGAVTGAFLGGPVGALAGSLVGAGVVTVHLLKSHPQANLETGTVLQFTLTEPLHLTPAASTSDNSSQN